MFTYSAKISYKYSKAKLFQIDNPQPTGGNCRPGNNFCLSGSLNQYFGTFCESAGFFDIAIRMRDVIPRLIALQLMYFCLFEFV